MPRESHTEIGEISKVFKSNFNDRKIPFVLLVFF